MDIIDNLGGMGDGHFFVGVDGSGVPIVRNRWWTTHQELIRIRRRSIKISIKYLSTHVWRERIGARRLGGTSRLYVWGLNWNNLTRNDEVYLRHSVQHWVLSLRKLALWRATRAAGVPRELYPEISKYMEIVENLIDD